MNNVNDTISILVTLHLILYAQSAFAAPTTADFMNATIACSAGGTIKIDSNLQGSMKSLYESESTKGKATLEVLTEIGKLLPQGETYKAYLDCLKSLLHS